MSVINPSSSIKHLITIIMTEMAASLLQREVLFSIYISNWINWKWLELSLWRSISCGARAYTLWPGSLEDVTVTAISIALRLVQTSLRARWWPVTHLAARGWFSQQQVSTLLVAQINSEMECSFRKGSHMKIVSLGHLHGSDVWTDLGLECHKR